MDHVIIYRKNKDAITRIKSGEKIGIVRAADSRKLPHGMVYEGDRLFFAENEISARILLKGVAGKVYNSERLSAEESNRLILENKEKYKLSESDIVDCMGKAFVSFVEIKDVSELKSPIEISIHNCETEWLVYDNIDDIISLM